jgi:Flp pilus assembly CpaF family ATPase
MFADPITLSRARDAFDVHMAPIAHLLRADDITDIMLNTPEKQGDPGPVWVDRVGIGLEFSGVCLDAATAEILIREFAAQSNVSAPLNDSHPRLSCQAALGQYRIEATISPASFAPTFVLRKYLRRGDITLPHYVESGEMTRSAVDQLAGSILSDEPATVLVGGETGSGKTTFLHPLLRVAGHAGRRRMVLIEDTPELELPPGPNTRLQVREESSFTYRDAVFSALRQRPDTIVLGEIRRPDDANQAVEAWNTGHQGMATIHAGNCQEMLWRLYSLCRQSESGRHVEQRTIASAIDLCVHLKRVRGKRIITVQRVKDWSDEQKKFVLEELV